MNYVIHSTDRIDISLKAIFFILIVILKSLIIVIRLFFCLIINKISKWKNNI